MKVFIKAVIILLLLTKYASCDEPNIVSWGNVASMNPEDILLKTNEYISLKIPKLKGVSIKLKQINVSYYFAQKYHNLNVLLIHENSFTDQSSARNVLVDDKQETILFNLIEYVFIDFNDKGLPYKHRVEMVPFHGGQKDFTEEFMHL